MEILEARIVLSSTPIISEFLASNSGGLVDEDGDSGDWIEIYNPTAAAIDLAGWSLTDSASDHNKWTFPHVTVNSDDFLVVFADGKDRTTGPKLHTNFSLSAGGEYLGLYNASGAVVSEYTPTYPAQLSNVSYGVEFDTSDLIPASAPAQTLVPVNGSLGSSWTSPTFTPAGWQTGPTGVGFGIVQPGFNITYIKATRSIDDLSVANQIIATASLQASVTQTTAPVINYMGTGGGGHYGNDLAFPTQTINQDIDWFLIQATGKITIPSTGNWSFGANTDDGFSLQLSRNGVVFNSQFAGLRGPSDTFATFNIPQAGDWDATFVMFENGGGSSAELFAAQGSLGSFTSAFHLVGDTASGGLAANSVPGGGASLSVGTDVRATMQNANSTAYVRVPFTVSGPVNFDEMHLDMRYDDGYVAYLNGVEVARRNAPATLAFNSTATAKRTIADAVARERVNLTPYINQLQTGTNVLAIQGLNFTAADGSFLVLPELTASSLHVDEPRFFETPTPGDPNQDPSLGTVDKVTSSTPAGFYVGALNVSLATTTPGATIRYTTDGSTPTATHGTIYSGLIPISQTTTLRAQAFKTGYLSLPSVTWTYLFLDDVLLQSPSDDVAGGYPDVGAPPPGWPSTWGANTVDYGMDQTVINQEGAARVKSGLMSLPTISIATDLPNLFDASTGIYSNAYQDGRDWERPASIEMINPDGSAGFQIDAGLRLRGGYSRSTGNPKHGFRLFFRGEYGNGSLDYPLFGTAPGAATSFKEIDLRTAENYSWSFGGDPSMTMIQDGFESASMLAMGGLATHARWVNLYLDGQFWGLYQFEERPEADFGATYLGGDAGNFDVVKVEAGPYTIYATDGNLDAYQRLWTYVTTHDMSTNANYFYLQGKNALGIDDPSIPNSDVLLDVDDVALYMISILQGGNLDAPISAFLGNAGVNNFFAIRDRTSRTGFKFVLHDSEHTLLDVNANREGPFNTGGPGDFQHFNPQYIHQLLMANPEYRQRFADLVEKNLFNNGPMTVANMQARYQKDVNSLDLAIMGESARWGDSKRQTSPLMRSDWLAAVSFQRDNFLANRNPVVLSQFRANGLFPTLDAPQYLVNGTAQTSGVVTPGSKLRFSSSSIVYYTTDGSDPRLLGGAINPWAQSYDPSSTSTTLLASGSTWKYNDKGIDLGAAWRATAYNDTTWSSGRAELGYGDGDEATVVSYGPNASAKYITTYFRTTFNVANIAAITGLMLSLKRDDGAVIYINGAEAARSNMPTGAIAATSLASTAVGGSDESTYFPLTIDSNLLVNGQNVIAVEIHQSDPTSSDISFDAQLVATTQNALPINLAGAANFKARAFSGTTWSAEADASYVAPSVPAAAGNLVVTEVHYNPLAEPGATTAPYNDKENYEFIELRNIGNQNIDLTGVRFTQGVTFDFTSASIRFLEPGQVVVIAGNLQAFNFRYGTGLPVAGAYTGNLDNGGERLTMVDAGGATIQSFKYDDEQTTTPKWPATPDGAGPSLTVIDVAGDYNSPGNWRASYVVNGTPGVVEANAALPAFTSTPSTTFAFGVAGNFTATASGSPAPTFSSPSNLPTGVALSPGGVLSSTAATPAGIYTITLTATNFAGAVNQTFQLVVSAPPAFTSTPTTTFTAGVAGSFAVTSSGTPPPTFSTSSLPAGVALAPSGQLTSTTATPAGVYTIVITATNNAGAVNQTFTLNVVQAPTFTSAATTTFTAGIAGLFTVAASGVPAPSFSTLSSVPAGVALSSSGQLTSTAATTAGVYTIVITATNSAGAINQTFTLNVFQAPSFTSAATTTFTAGIAGSFTVSASGVPAPTFSTSSSLPAGVALAPSGQLTSTTATPAGVYTIVIAATNSAGAVNQTFTLNVNKAPAFTSAATATFTAGVAGSFTVSASGVPAPTFSTSSSLPAGVALAPSGQLTSTTATPAGVYTIVIAATNSAGAVNQTFTLNVLQAPLFTSAPTTTIVSNVGGTFTVTASGVPAPTFVATGLPGSVTLSPAGLLTVPAGTPPGSTTFTITASNSAGAVNQSFTLAVNAAPSITSAASTTFTAGTPGSFAVIATGTPLPTFSATGLPSGVSLSSAGSLTSTTAAAAGTYPLVITAANGVSPAAQQNLTLTILPGGATATTTSLTATSQGPSTNGQVYGLTATVAPTPAIPAGTVTFFDGAVPIGTVSLAGNSATINGLNLSLGVHNLKAVYNGNATSQASPSAVLTLNVGAAATLGLASSQTPSTFGAAVTFTATLNVVGGGTADGSVTFYDNGVLLGSAAIAGSAAALRVASLTVGSHAITALYAGSAGTAASPAFTHVVQPMSPSARDTAGVTPPPSAPRLLNPSALTILNRGATLTGGFIVQLPDKTAYNYNLGAAAIYLPGNSTPVPLAVVVEPPSPGSSAAPVTKILIPASVLPSFAAGQSYQFLLTWAGAQLPTAAAPLIALFGGRGF